MTNKYTPPPPEKLNAASACRILGIQPTKLKEWTAAGMPYYPGEHIYQDRYVIGEIVAWHIEMGEKGYVTMTATEAKRRREVAMAMSAELDLSVKRGELVVLADLMAEFENALIEVRARIASQSGRLAGILANQDEDKVIEILEQDANDILEALSGYEHP